MWGRPRGTFERFVEITTGSFDPSLWFLAMDATILQRHPM